MGLHQTWAECSALQFGPARYTRSQNSESIEGRPDLSDTLIVKKPLIWIIQGIVFFHNTLSSHPTNWAFLYT